MKRQNVALLTAILLAVPATVLVACSSDPDPVGPTNNVDAGKDTSSQVDTGTQDSGADSGPNVCVTGLTFDNKRVPGFPVVPQP
ncbi:hypothetical protein BH09MYX1_BH09MYX1_34290 [soil metagenome]